MPTMGETSENASANAERSVKSRTGCPGSTVVVADSGRPALAISDMAVLFSQCGNHEPGDGDSRVNRGGWSAVRTRDPVRILGKHGLRAGPGGQVQRADVARDLADRGDPEPVQRLHAL